MTAAVRRLQRPLRSLTRGRRRCMSSQPPPPPPARPYRAPTEGERQSRRKPDQEPEAPRPSSLGGRLSAIFNPFHEPASREEVTPPAPEAPAPRDLERGIAASQRYVKEGVLDQRYKGAARRWQGIIIGSVVLIGLTPEMYRRVYLREGRKELPPVKSKTEGALEGGKSAP